MRCPGHRLTHKRRADRLRAQEKNTGRTPTDDTPAALTSRCADPDCDELTATPREQKTRTPRRGRPRLRCPRHRTMKTKQQNRARKAARFQASLITGRHIPGRTRPSPSGTPPIPPGLNKAEHTDWMRRRNAAILTLLLEGSPANLDRQAAIQVRDAIAAGDRNAYQRREITLDQTKNVEMPDHDLIRQLQATIEIAPTPGVDEILCRRPIPKSYLKKNAKQQSKKKRQRPPDFQPKGATPPVGDVAPIHTK